MEEYIKDGFNEYGIKVYDFYAHDPIKPYHIKESILSYKDVVRLKKKIDSHTNMKGPYKLDNLKYKFEEKPKTKIKKLNNQNANLN